jgi:hypothetical protein
MKVCATKLLHKRFAIFRGAGLFSLTETVCRSPYLFDYAACGLSCAVFAITNKAVGNAVGDDVYRVVGM